MNTGAYHIPVLADEVVRFLNPRPKAVLVDGTLGGGGHALRLGESLQPDGTLVVIDQDPAAIEEALAKLEGLELKLVSLHGNFRDIRSLLNSVGISEVDGLLLDLGVSWHQLDAGERGFSFRADARLDMRMNPTSGETAAELLARVSERDLTKILLDLGEERWAARIARFIVEQRAKSPLETTAQLANLVSAAIPKKAQPQNIHPATRTFQALRIFVNDELASLQEALNDGFECLCSGGRLAVISYHSLEDRIVKQTFARLAGRCQCPPGLPICLCGAEERATILTRKPVLPTEEEIKRNPRSRSARLRVAERI